MIQLFLGRLLVILAKEDPSWRDRTVFLLDGASYHKSEATRKFLDNLGIRVMISAPYSFAAAPVELFFAYFKKGNINTQGLPMGKK